MSLVGYMIRSILKWVKILCFEEHFIVIQSEPTVKKFKLAKVTIRNNSKWMDKVKNRVK